MRTGVFTAPAVSLLFASMAKRSVSQTVVHADRVVVLKKERTLELLS
jgi:hypothetical protein